MTLYWAVLAGITILNCVGCVASYIALRRSLRRALSDRQLATEHQMCALAAKLKTLESRLAEQSKAQAPPAAAPVLEMKAANPAKLEIVAPQKEEVAPEVMAVIAAAVTSFLGKKARIRSVRELQTPTEFASPWSQQGRVFVQASHNLQSRR